MDSFLNAVRKRTRMRAPRGFSLLEMLIVIALIGILATITIVAIRGSRTNARDIERITELQQLARAMELFYDKYQVYPCGDENEPAGLRTQDDSLDSVFLDGNEALPPANCTGDPKSGLYTAGYLGIVSLRDPLNTSQYYYFYLVSADRQDYLLFSRLEDDDVRMSSDRGLCNNYFETGSGLGSMLPTADIFGVSCN